MKLIPLIFLTIYLAVDSNAHEHFTFPPQFQTPHSIYPPDKSPYLPPESPTPVPYFPINNVNLPFPFLPPSNSKAPIGYPSPLPIMMSSTFMPVKNEDENEDEDSKPTTPFLQSYRTKSNHTERNNQRAERREFRAVPRNFQQPIDRKDSKIPFHLGGSIEVTTQNVQTKTPRSIIISDFQRPDIYDNIKASSFQAAQYVPQPTVFVSSTTETAIPILRLSNEMDLDGSFSYEALGADQTHYVQHSRMENMGTDKEEQVVEGSYSYVGSDGKTYTVHYIADSNGFRAIGDHLPVAPPVPEIIQRAIQYNLAEEAKKPPSLKSWNDQQKENEISESERRLNFAISPPRLNTLFTGKAPESFSHSYQQTANTQNNMVATASTQTSPATIEFATNQMQSKSNGGTISPQITFLASQGARVPSANSPQTISRMFTTEKSTMPQLVNYEASIKENDQDNRALWRWQYGINSNGNQNVDKNSISRSSSDDDIMINFSDMTSDQYTQVINQQLGPSPRTIIETSPQVEHPNIQQNGNQPNNPTISSSYEYNNNYLNRDTRHNLNLEPTNLAYSTERSTTQSAPEVSSETLKEYSQKTEEHTNQMQKQITQSSRSNLITQQQFIPPSQMVTRSYDYNDDDSEDRRSKIMNTENVDNVNLNVIPLNYDKSSQSNLKSLTKQIENGQKTNPVQNRPILSTVKNVKFSDFIVSENDDFKPLFSFTEPHTEVTITTEPSLENIFIENVFLKNMFRNKEIDEAKENKIMEDNKNFQVKPIIDRLPKYNQHQPKIYSENKNVKRKPVDMVELLNYITKNQFESNKIRAKPKQSMTNYKQNNEMHYYAPEEDDYNEEKNNRQFRTLQQGELSGAIKNYKVLQRNNNIDNFERDNTHRLRRNSGSSTVKYNIPPLGRAGPSPKSYLPPVH